MSDRIEIWLIAWPPLPQVLNHILGIERLHRTVEFNRETSELSELSRKTILQQEPPVPESTSAQKLHSEAVLSREAEGNTMGHRKRSGDDLSSSQGQGPLSAGRSGAAQAGVANLSPTSIKPLASRSSLPVYLGGGPNDEGAAATSPQERTILEVGSRQQDKTSELVAQAINTE